MPRLLTEARRTLRRRDCPPNSVESFACSSGLPAVTVQTVVLSWRRATASDLRMGSAPGLGNVTSPTAPGSNDRRASSACSDVAIADGLSTRSTTRLRAWSSTQFPNPRRLRRAAWSGSRLSRPAGLDEHLAVRVARTASGRRISRNVCSPRGSRARCRREILHSVARWPTCRRLDRPSGAVTWAESTLSGRSSTRGTAASARRPRGPASPPAYRRGCDAGTRLQASGIGRCSGVRGPWAFAPSWSTPRPPSADQDMTFAARWAGLAGIIALLVAAVAVGALLLRPFEPVHAELIQGGLDHPWDIAFTDDGRMLVTERIGRVRVYASGEPGAPLLHTATHSGRSRRARVRADGDRRPRRRRLRLRVPRSRGRVERRAPALESWRRLLARHRSRSCRSARRRARPATRAAPWRWTARTTSG